MRIIFTIFFASLSIFCLEAAPKNPKYTPVIMPNGETLPYVMDNGVKVFHLIAEPVQQEFALGFIVNCWGYNGHSPGPMIQAVEGDTVRILVTNNLPEPTTIHCHGLLLPSGMDGVTGLNQPPIPPGETFKYEFVLKQHGTYMYHSHYDEVKQLGLGLMGFFIIHPKTPEVKVDRDFAIFLHEWAIPAGSRDVNPMEMTDFNYYTMNGRVYPGTEPLVIKKGERVRIRFANLSMDNHPMHLHGYAFTVTGESGWRRPKSAQYLANTVDVVVAVTRDIEFVADYPGDWALHCHKSHHVTSGMEHGKGKEMGDMPMPKVTNPFSKGFPGPFGKIDMSGMFTIVKVREDITNYNDPGWYKNPPGTVAGPVNMDSNQNYPSRTDAAQTPNERNVRPNTTYPDRPYQDNVEDDYNLDDSNPDYSDQNRNVNPYSNRNNPNSNLNPLDDSNPDYYDQRDRNVNPYSDRNNPNSNLNPLDDSNPDYYDQRDRNLNPPYSNRNNPNQNDLDDSNADYFDQEDRKVNPNRNNPDYLGQEDKKVNPPSSNRNNSNQNYPTKNKLGAIKTAREGGERGGGDRNRSGRDRGDGRDRSNWDRGNRRGYNRDYGDEGFDSEYIEEDNASSEIDEPDQEYFEQEDVNVGRSYSDRNNRQPRRN